MNKDVVFKGSRTGLQLVLNESVEFSDILIQLRNKLESAMGFFGKGTTIHVDPDLFDEEQQIEVENLLQQYGMFLKILLPQAEPEQIVETQLPSEEEVMVIEQTIRGGQEIIHDGSILIKGNVNPGAQVIAGGNIKVEGTCRGIVHAGAYGDADAIIVADRMRAMQIRIADLAARAPDHLEEVNYPECARIKNGEIVIESVNEQEDIYE